VPTIARGEGAHICDNRVVLLAPSLVADQALFDDIAGIPHGVLTEAWTKL
jgi:hypothetical protein